MKPSPIQTKSIVYGDIHIAPYEYPEGISAPGEAFAWTGVNIRTSTRFGRLDDSDRAYALLLRIQVPNEEGNTMAPYTLNVSIMGTFEYVGPDRADSTDLIVVNGLSILYSSLRETVMMLTARMMHGVLCLPGANFMDHAPSRNAADSHQETPKKKRGKTLARKKTGS